MPKKSKRINVSIYPQISNGKITKYNYSMTRKRFKGLFWLGGIVFEMNSNAQLFTLWTRLITRRFVILELVNDADNFQGTIFYGRYYFWNEQ